MAMQIYIRSTIGNAETFSIIGIDSSVNIKDLKQRICKEHKEYVFGNFGLVYDEEFLDNDDTLSDFDITSGSLLDLINITGTSRNLNNVGLKFADVTADASLKCIQWSQTAPEWRRARHGLCLEGECKNRECEAHKNMVVISIGYKKIDLAEDIEKLKCPICKKYVEPVTCAFNNCWWRYEGKINSPNGPPEQRSGKWTKANDAYHRFDEGTDKIASWRTLVLETAKELPSNVELSEKILDNEMGVQISEEVSESSTAVAASIPPKHASPPAKENEDVNWRTHRDKFWCPWNSGSCKNELIIKGQGTIEIMQNKSIPFEIRLSTSANPNDNSAYFITLSVKEDEVILKTSTGQSYQSKDFLHCLQSNDQRWHRYWISLYNCNIKYGVGEIRPFFAVLNCHLPENDIEYAKKIQYIHVKIDNNDQMLTQLDDLKENFRFYIDKKPVLYDPPMFIISNSEYNTNHAIDHTAIPPSQLEKPCRDLYDSVINFKLNDIDFPDLTDIIEKSIKNPRGWCYQKLMEKANRFGKPNIKATYLRLTLGRKEGQAPGHTFVIEVWPPGHFSPIHNHSNAYAIIRVLSGEVLIKLYPELRINVKQCEPIEQICHEGQVTWLLPNLNQTHQLKHVDLYGKTCVTLQCYQYGIEDQRHYEYFDFITNDKQSINQFDPKSDMDFYEFKQRMQDEKNNIFRSSLE